MVVGESAGVARDAVLGDEGAGAGGGKYMARRCSGAGRERVEEMEGRRAARRAAGRGAGAARGDGWERVEGVRAGACGRDGRRVRAGDGVRA